MTNFEKIYRRMVADKAYAMDVLVRMEMCSLCREAHDKLPPEASCNDFVCPAMCFERAKVELNGEAVE